MRKLAFATVAAFFTLFSAWAQPQDSVYKKKKLTFEEASLVSSYYRQSGDNAVVTGGIGSQKLTDISNIIDVRWVKYDKKDRKNILNAELGIDHYSSASSDMVDLKANSSASSADTRFYPSVSLTRENSVKGSSVGISLGYSHEFDYDSFNAGFSFSQKTKNRNGEFSARLQGFADKVRLILPIELRNSASGEDEEEGSGYSNRNSVDLSLNYSQIINKRLQVSLHTDLVHQSGFLSLPFHRVYFNDGSVHQELLPDNRLKIPLGVRANYFLGDRFIVKTYYRYYTDSWGIRSHTMDLEVPVKLNAFLSVSPFYRYYTQTAVDYFKAYGEHTAQDKYYTSNYDLSKFNSSFFGAGIR
ncbi:MAG: DUF3570 domain-containing protein, partial [Chitinophagaceae bacterium]